MKNWSLINIKPVIDCKTIVSFFSQNRFSLHERWTLPLSSFVREGIWVAREDVGLCLFYSLYVKERKLFTKKIAQTILRNYLLSKHLQLNYASCLTSLTSKKIIKLTAEIYFHSSHVIPLNETISNYFVNWLLPILFANAIVST